MVNNMKTEMDFVKKMFSVQKLQQIDQSEQKMRNVGYEVEVLKMNMETVVKKRDLDQVYHKMQDYAPLKMIKDMQEDIGDFVNREEFNITLREIDFVKRDLGQLCSKEELMTRLNVFNSEVNIKLHDRPTISYFKKVLHAYDAKIDQVNDTLKENLQKLDVTQAHQDDEIAQLNTEVTNA